MIRCKACNAKIKIRKRKVDGVEVWLDLCKICWLASFPYERTVDYLHALTLEELEDLNLPFDDDDESTPPE